MGGSSSSTVGKEQKLIVRRHSIELQWNLNTSTFNSFEFLNGCPITLSQFQRPRIRRQVAEFERNFCTSFVIPTAPADDALKMAGVQIYTSILVDVQRLEKSRHETGGIWSWHEIPGRMDNAQAQDKHEDHELQDIVFIAKVFLKETTNEEFLSRLKIGLRIVSAFDGTLHESGLRPLQGNSVCLKLPSHKLMITEQYFAADVLHLRFDITYSIESPDENDRMDKLCSDLLQQYHSGAGADFEIICGAVTIPVHSVILSARSKVFRRMFEIDMQEKQSRTVHMGDVEPQILKTTLEYIYSSRLPTHKLTFEELCKLVRLAEQYELYELKEICFDLLEKSMNHQSCGELAVLAFLLSPKIGISDRVCKYCSEHWFELCRIPEFQKCVRKYPDAFLQFSGSS